MKIALMCLALMALVSMGCGAGVDRPDGLSDEEWEIYLEAAVTATAEAVTATAEARESAINQAKAQAEANAMEEAKFEEDIKTLVHSIDQSLGYGLSMRDLDTHPCSLVVGRPAPGDNVDIDLVRQKIMDEFRTIHPNITDGEAFLNLSAKCGHVGIFDIANLSIPKFRWATPTPSRCPHGRDEEREWRNPQTFALIKVKCHSGIPTPTRPFRNRAR